MFQQPNKTVDFDAIRLRVASPDVIRGWSYGEVTKAETINYRTQKPEKDGLFDEKIFGPEKDWECYCGKYKKIRYKGIVCDKCGVEVTHSSVRRERMGHLELASPVTHIWFLRGVPSRLGLLLDISAQNLEKVVYFANFIIIHVDEEGKKAAIEQLKEEYKQQKKQIEAKFKNQVNQLQTNAGLSDKEKESKIIAMNKVRDDEYVELDVEFAKTESELKNLEVKQIISENQYQDLSLKFGHLFEAEIGGEALFTLLSRLDLGKLITVLAKELEEASGAKREKLHKRLQLMRNLHRNDIKPDHLLLSVIPVIPPDLRPMVPLDGGRFATSDLNDLYRRVINRNNRLKKLKELNAPEVIIRNEKRMLQEAVDALLDNSARATKTTTASTGQKRELKSLADLLKGKQGRFRQNLLGKRIDYSGRSVIVVGPHLKLHQCGLPKKMALELFRPFIISQLIKREYVHNIRSANKFIEANRPEIWDILEEIVADAHVLLNRAPTLHRLGIQAFQPTLIEGKAIQLHPLVCTAFNADFDGDQMAVHVPLTEKAKEEAATLMLSSHNLLKPADGRPVSTPKMDVVWGLFYITDYNDVKEPKVFFDAKEAKQAWQMGLIHLRDKIIVKTLDQVPDKKMIETNVGRIFFNEVVPEGLPFYNQRIDSKFLADIVKYCLEKLGQDITAKLLDDVKNLGFKYLTLSGYSWGMDDLPSLDKKPAVIAEGDAAIEAIQEQFAEGLLTRSERYAKIIETWTNIKDRIVQMTKDSLDVTGPVYSMITAGARGSWTQVVQMVGMKGLVTSPTGEIIELPVKGNFKSGFDVLEYYISTHGSRKGLSDTALRTANAGYLTRRLVDVAQDVVVSKPDCGDKEGQVYTKEESEIIGVKLLDRVWGRITLDDIVHPKTGLVVVKKGEHINEEHYRQLADADLNDVRVRSVLTCYMPKGVCQKCYGYDLGYNKPVGLGIAAGIVAAQSIGEPGTQLTMRTFHTGGVAGDDITQGLPRVEELFEARQPKKKAFMAEQAGQVSISDALMQIVDEAGVVTEVAAGGKAIRIKFDGVQEEVYKCKGSTTFKVKDDETVKKGDVLFEDSTGEVVALHKGVAKVLKSSVKLIAEVEQETEYLIPAGVRINVKNGDLVGLGDQLTEGSIELQQLFRVKGRDAVKRYIVKEIQYIYSSQGQRLNEKHIEVIIRQLFSRLLVRDAGDTNLLTGEVVERAEYEDENNRIEAEGGKLAVADDLFLGISKVALSTKSFLSAASFQETSKVLINAATTGKIDRLEGLKENVIIGRLIPAGTGFAASEEAKSRRLGGKGKE